MEPDAPLEEYTPKGWSGQPQGQRVPDDGWHLITAHCEEANFEGMGYEKPYLLIQAVVTSQDYSGFKFSFRLYLHPKAENWCRWCLKKGGYAKELLAANPPVVRRSAVIGLEWMLLVLVSTESGYVDVDVKGFGHADGDPELQQKYFRLRGQQESAEDAVDLYDDLKEAQVSSTGQAAPDGGWGAAEDKGWPEDEKR